MNAVQLSLLEDAWSPLDETIEKIRSHGARHNNYVRFVRMVAASAIGQRPGSIILCAALSDYDAVEISTDIKQLIQETLGKRADPISDVCMVETPHALRAREMRAALVEAYHHADNLFCPQPKSEPQFQLEGAPAYLGQNPAQRVAGLLKHRASKFYLFRNIQLLQRIDSQPADALEFVRMLAHIATASERTHILLGNAHTVLRWLKTKEIAEVVVPVVLEPYDFDNDNDKTHFLSLLAGYDLELPWDDDDLLVRNAAYVHGVVAGSPHRFRKWLLNALCRTRALAQAELTWKCFVESAPTGTETTQAKQEFRSVREFLGKPTETADPSPSQPPKKDLKPGTRSLGRDTYAA